jgi:hypothetical protein
MKDAQEVDLLLELSLNQKKGFRNLSKPYPIGFLDSTPQETSILQSKVLGQHYQTSSHAPKNHSEKPPSSSQH